MGGWDALVKDGPGFGYHSNALKTWLIVMENKFEEGCCAFGGP